LEESFFSIEEVGWTRFRRVLGKRARRVFDASLAKSSTRFRRVFGKDKGTAGKSAAAAATLARAVVLLIDVDGHFLWHELSVDGPALPAAASRRRWWWWRRRRGGVGSGGSGGSGGRTN